jgi:FAD/FMN-containing dehydrogenase
MELKRPIDRPTGKFQPGPSVMEKLREGYRGDLIMPGDAAYDEARRVWNGAIDRRPALIAYCADTNDVIQAVTFARSHNCLVAVRSGGHNVAGLSVCDDGMVIDLSRMKHIAVDPISLVAHAEAGLSLGEFARDDAIGRTVLQRFSLLHRTARIR